MSDLLYRVTHSNYIKMLDRKGLILFDQLENGDYESTPYNVLTFARTGGDGVHFSLLNYTSNTDTCPIIMTVPMNDDNIVLGENLWEFLSLGYYCGYFFLEQLSYNVNKGLSLLDREDLLDEDIGEFKSYRKFFNLKPWNHIKDRLHVLKLKYYDKLLWNDNNTKDY